MGAITMRLGSSRSPTVMGEKNGEGMMVSYPTEPIDTLCVLFIYTWFNVGHAVVGARPSRKADMHTDIVSDG